MEAGVMVHLFCSGGLKFDDTAMVQYLLVKGKANQNKYTIESVKKSLNL